jgi:hypothetical protein
MQRRPLNISAALAIAIERQVDDIIANAKTQCALEYRASPRRGFPGPTMSDLAAFALPANLGDADADRRREHNGTLRTGSRAPGSEDPVAEPTPGQLVDIWKRLRSLLTPRPFRA